MFTTGRLSARLFEVDSVRRRYEARMAELLEDAWNEDALLAEVDRVSALLGTDVDATTADVVRGYIANTRADIEAELTRGLPALPAGSVGAPVCLYPAAVLSGTFDTTFDTLDITQLTETRGTLTWTSDPPTVNLPQQYDAVAGLDPQLMNTPTVRVLGQRVSGQVLVVAFPIAPEDFESGTVIPLSGLTALGVVVELTFRPTGPLLRSLGVLTNGTLTLDEVDATSGGRIAGSFSGQFYEQR